MFQISGTNLPTTSMDLLRLILINQMNMKQERVFIYNEKFKIPDDDDLFIVVEYRNGKTLGNNNIFKISDETNLPIEIQIVNMLEKIVVGIFSRNREAEYRKEEVLMSIKSSYAQYIQEQYAFKIARAADIEDLSSLEGASMLKRYDIEISVYAWYKRIITPGFMVPPANIIVWANNGGTGIIEAEITASSQQPAN